MCASEEVCDVPVCYKGDRVVMDAFADAVVNVVVVSESGIESETRYFGICVRV